MRIASVHVHPLVFPLDPPYGDANGPKYYRSCIIVSLSLEDGTVGIGEATGRLPETWLEARRAYASAVGQDVRDIRTVLQTIGNVSPRVRAGLEIALWDALGKSLQLPLYRLLGGGSRTLPLYASFQNAVFQRDGMTREGYVEHVSDLVEDAVRHGFTRVKIKVGAMPLEWDIAVIEHLGKLWRDSVEFAVDANESFCLDTGLRVARVLEAVLPRLLWFEEPFPLQNVTAYRRLQQRSDVPVSGGENLRTSEDFVQLATVHQFDIGTPDVLHIGGILSFLSAVNVLQAHGCRVTPHSFDGGVARWACLHAMACAHPLGKGFALRAFDPVEWDWMMNPFTSSVLSHRHQVGDGTVQLSDDPGLGLDYNAQAARAFIYTGRQFRTR